MQVSVDMFLFSSGYQDVASLGEGHCSAILFPIIEVSLSQLACLTILLVRLSTILPSTQVGPKMLLNLLMSLARFLQPPSCWKL